MKKKLLSIILFVLIFSISLFSNTIKVSTLQKNNNLLNKVSYYIDKSAKKDFSFIENNNDIFKYSTFKKVKKSFTTDIYWFKFSIYNDTNYRISKSISINNPIINNVKLFIKTKEHYHIKTDGIKKDKKFKNLLTPHFDIILDSKEKKDFYLKISSKTTPLVFDIFFLDKNLVYEKEMNHQLVLAMFFASILTLIFYNFAIFIFTKDKAYLYYISYFFLLIVYYSYYTNMGYYIIDIQINFVAIYLLSFMIIFLILFIRTFLETFNFKKIDFILKSIIIFLIALCIFTSKDFYPINIVISVLMLCLFFILFTAYYSLYKGVQQAKYIVLGWSIAVIGYLYFAFLNYNILDEKFIIPYFYETAIFLEALIFSTALVNKLNTTKKLQEQLEKNEILIKEIHHRVKNNMQFIVSIYRLKLSKIINSEISENLDDIENTIQAIGKTHEMLYKNTNLEFIEAKPYFQSLVDELKYSFNLKDIEISVKTNITLSMEYSMICGIILNEAITNSIKHAFINQEGKINISLIKENDNYNLTIEDNGKGYDNSKKQNGFGLSLIHSLTVSNLNGKCQIESNTGTSISIEFKS